MSELVRCPKCGERKAEDCLAGTFYCHACGHEFPDPFYVKKVGTPANVLAHRNVCNELNNLYEKKNRDYGDSFHKTYLEEGMAMARIRLTDKLERFKKLTREGGRAVKDESIRDTLIDLANYAIMTVMEMDREAEENGCG
jgi:hypothetical protein